MTIEIVQLLVSPLHRYEGRPADGALPEPPGELVEAITIRAGLGVVGDRYFGKRAYRNAAVTIMAAEPLDALNADLRQTRRNILLRGADVDALVGTTISLDSGAGPIDLRVHRPANPCAWLDAVIGDGSRKALRGKGGVRCEPLTDGTLQLGPVSLRVTEPVNA